VTGMAQIGSPRVADRHGDLTQPPQQPVSGGDRAGVVTAQDIHWLVASALAVTLRAICSPVCRYHERYAIAERLAAGPRRDRGEWHCQWYKSLTLILYPGELRRHDLEFRRDKVAHETIYGGESTLGPGPSEQTVTVVAACLARTTRAVPRYIGRGARARR
jgi:hypothetical protein